MNQILKAEIFLKEITKKTDLSNPILVVGASHWVGTNFSVCKK